MVHEIVEWVQKPMRKRNPKNRPLSDRERQTTERYLQEILKIVDDNSLPKEKRERLKSLIGQIAATLAQDAEMKKELAARPGAAGGQDANPPPRPGEPGDQIDIGGDIGQVSVVGGGTLKVEGGVAGRDNKTVHGTLVETETVIITSDAAPVKVTKNGIDELERAYLKRVMESARRVPLGQLDLQAAGSPQPSLEVKLDALYVPLDTTNTQRAVGGKRGERVNVPLLTSVIRNPWMVILGDPGSGKSTFINFLTMVLADTRLNPAANSLEYLNVPGENGQQRATWSYKALLPVRVDLSEFVSDIPAEARKGTSRMVWDHIVKQLKEQNLGGFATLLEKKLVDGKCLFMFDGLDEISDMSRRRLVIEAIQNFAATHGTGDNRLIVTCRVLSYTDPKWQIPDFPSVTLAPLSASGIKRFISNWYRALINLGHIDQQEARIKAEELKNATAGLHDLAENPLILTVMALVHTYRGFLPRERVRLYQDCIDLLLWDWQRTKRIGPDHWEAGIIEQLDTRQERLSNALCEVAFTAHKKQGDHEDTVDIPQTELYSILQSYLGNDWGKAQTFGVYVEQRAGLLMSRGTSDKGDNNKVYAFAHRAFQEFLAGRFVVAGRDFSRQIAKLAAQGDGWHEVILLAAGHQVYNLEQIHEVLDAINLLCPADSPTDPAGWRNVWWAAEMLQIVGREAAEQDEFIGKKLVERVSRQLVKLVKAGELEPRERAQAADILGLLGDPRPGVVVGGADKIAMPEMVNLPGGLFELGEGEQRRRRRIKAFALARYPVTNAQFRQFAEKHYEDDRFWTAEGRAWRQRAARHRGLVDDATWGIDNRPVVGISWHEAVAYTLWLSSVSKRAFRLPTECEWERAAVGKEERRYPFGPRANKHITNFREAEIGQTAAVGIFPEDRTPEGIYDMAGNVWEWCQPADEKDEARVLRGGGYDTPREKLHSTQRYPVDPGAHVRMIGFRVASDPE